MITLKTLAMMTPTTIPGNIEQVVVGTSEEQAGLIPRDHVFGYDAASLPEIRIGINDNGRRSLVTLTAVPGGFRFNVEPV